MGLYSPKKLNKTPLGETGCSSNLYTFSFLIHSLLQTQSVRLPEATATYCAALP